MTQPARSTYIGGGDQVHLLQVAPYGCYRRLVLSKRDPREEDLSDNIHIMRGNYLEPAIAKMYEDQTGRKLRNYTRKVRPETKTGAALDRHIVAFDDRGPGVLEIKAPSAMMFRKYLRDGLPAEYSAQLNWYMGFEGWKWGSFAVANYEVAPGLLWFDVAFDAERYDAQLAQAAEAWRMIEFGPLPDPLPHTSRACSRCPYFEQCHPADLPTPDAGELVQIATPELAAALADYRAAHEVAAEAEELKEEAKGRIKAAIGDATAVEAPGGRIYHRATVRNGIDAKKLKREFPQAAEACKTETTVRSLRIYERTN
jgi:predicted phage-related endonuclease